MTKLRALSLEGSSTSDIPALVLQSNSLQTLTHLQFLSLKRIELLEDAIKEAPVVVEVPHEDPSNPSNLIYLVEENEAEILPFEEFKKLNESKWDPVWDGFKSLAKLEYLFIVNCSLPEAFRRGHSGAFASLRRLKELAVRSSRLLVRLETGSSDFKELEYLSLADNELLDLDSTDLRGLDAIASLDLSGNRLTRFTEQSLPLMPDLESLDLGRNPIQMVYSNAFSSVPSLRRLRLDSSSNKDARDCDSCTAIQTGSFNGLSRLQELWLGPARTDSDILSSDYFKDLISLMELHLRGRFVAIEADTFASSRRLQLLDLKQCGLSSLSIDSFQGLSKLRVLDLSDNKLTRLPSGVFDPLNSLKELWLTGNQLTTVPADVFAPLGPSTKMIRLERNPWHCTCELNQLKPTVVNKAKVIDPATNRTWYNYERRVSPVCASPESFRGASVFDVMRKPLRCNKLANAKPSSVWVAPSEAVDHGAEAAPDIPDEPRAEALKSQQDYDEDIIDHGEEVVDDPPQPPTAAPTRPPITPPLIKQINDVVQLDHSIKDHAPIKSTYYASLSKKALKLLLEQERSNKEKFKKVSDINNSI